MTVSVSCDIMQVLFHTFSTVCLWHVSQYPEQEPTTAY